MKPDNLSNFLEKVFRRRSRDFQRLMGALVVYALGLLVASNDLRTDFCGSKFLKIQRM